jgi:archaellum component FlaC
MADERGRLALHQRLVEVLGEEAAVTLMDHLPPSGTDIVTRQDLQATEARIEQRFERIDSQFDRIDDRFGMVNDQFDRIDDRFGMVNDQFDRIDDRFAAVDSRFGMVDDRFDRLDTRIDALEQRLDERMRLFIATTIAAVFSAVLATAGVVLAAGAL